MFPTVISGKNIVIQILFYLKTKNSCLWIFYAKYNIVIYLFHVLVKETIIESG